MSDLAVVPAGPGDIGTIRELFLEYRDELGVSLCFQGFDEELVTLPGAYAPPRGALLLLKEGDAVAGCVALRPLPGDSGGDACEMKRLYVRPAFRGRGGGRQLTEAVTAAARRAGHGRICLDTLARMTAAQALYGSLGFREVPAYYDNPLAGARYFALELQPPIARAG
jgi:ribosomal protein S18 acetylase RimI-like enzyme